MLYRAPPQEPSVPSGKARSQAAQASRLTALNSVSSYVPSGVDLTSYLETNEPPRGKPVEKNTFICIHTHNR